MKRIIQWFKDLFVKPKIDRKYLKCSHCCHGLAMAYGDKCPNCGWAI